MAAQLGPGAGIVPAVVLTRTEPHRTTLEGHEALRPVRSLPPDLPGLSSRHPRGSRRFVPLFFRHSPLFRADGHSSNKPATASGVRSCRETLARWLMHCHRPPNWERAIKARSSRSSPLFYFSPTRRFRWINHPNFRNSLPSTRHLPRPSCRPSSCGLGGRCRVRSVCLPVGRQAQCLSLSSGDTILNCGGVPGDPPTAAGLVGTCPGSSRLRLPLKIVHYEYRAEDPETNKKSADFGNRVGCPRALRDRETSGPAVVGVGVRETRAQLRGRNRRRPGEFPCTSTTSVAST